MKTSYPIAWQQEYAAELKRTANKLATFEKRGGSWWTLKVGDAPSLQARQKSDVLKMTETLKLRPDFVSAAESKETVSAS